MESMRIAFVSTSVPRRCGIATFTADVMAAVKAADPTVRCSVIAIDEPNSARAYGPDVKARIRQFLKSKKPGQPDTDELLHIKKLIRETEARAGALVCGVPPEQLGPLGEEPSLGRRHPQLGDPADHLEDERADVPLHGEVLPVGADRALGHLVDQCRSHN